MKASKQVQWGSFTVPGDRLSFRDRVFIGASFLGILIWAFPHVTLAQTISNTPMVFEINNTSAVAVHEDSLGRLLAPNIVIPAPDPRVELLRQYLASKNSPLANEAPLLVQQYHYRLIIGISFAESNFCRYQIAPNNCWGIGGTKPESYPTLADGIVRTNNLIQKYQELGMTSPTLMSNTWVGWHNPSWPVAVGQVTQELESLGL